MYQPASQRHRGVSSIELALVLGATVILGGVGVSAYRTHSVRTEISASVTSLETVRQAVETSFRRTGMPPATSTQLDVPPLKHVRPLIRSVAVENGRIEVAFGLTADTAIAGRSLYLTPYETAEQHVIWVCGNRSPGIGLNPLGFSGGANVAVQPITGIDSRFLPPACR